MFSSRTSIGLGVLDFQLGPVPEQRLASEAGCCGDGCSLYRASPLAFDPHPGRSPRNVIEGIGDEDAVPTKRQLTVANLRIGHDVPAEDQLPSGPEPLPPTRPVVIPPFG